MQLGDYMTNQLAKKQICSVLAKITRVNIHLSHLQKR